jgi:hypothetical protein
MKSAIDTFVILVVTMRIISTGVLDLYGPHVPSGVLIMTSQDDYRYRVFLSYAQEDEKAAAQVVKWLLQLNLQPIWARHNPAGWPFLDEIKKQIDHSHVFIALLTPDSLHSTWVNHEIGYAMGRNVPVWPISLGPLPEGMMRSVQATRVQSIEQLLPYLDRALIHRLVKRAERAAVHECADLSDARTKAIIEHCKLVDTLGCAADHHQPLRHLAAFGSFCIPSDPRDPIWEDRSYEQFRNPDKRELLSEERRELEAYARRFGCDLVLYPKLRELTREEIQARHGVLKLFLQDIRDANVRIRVAFDRRGLEENLIILGDWFLVESLTPRPEGYRHTTITSHAPTVLKRIETFEMQFKSSDWLPPDDAINRLDEDF